MSNHRDRKLLDLAHDIVICMSCGKYTEGAEPAHSNLMRHGKGASIKSHDLFHAALCHECHRLIDAGRTDRTEAERIWQIAHERTMLYYWQHNLVKVAR